MSLFSVAALLTLLSGPASASPVDFHGFGAASMGRGAGGVALADDVTSIFLNPAALTRMEGGQFAMGYSAIRYRFDEKQNATSHFDRSLNEFYMIQTKSYLPRYPPFVKRR